MYLGALMKDILLTPIRFLRGLLLFFWLIFAGTLASVTALLFFWTDAGFWVVRNIYCRGFFIIMGFTPTYSGLELIDFKKTYVLVSNHESHMDVQSIFMSYPKYLRFIAKKELKYVPVVGWVIMSLGMLFVDRSNKDKARESMKKAAEKVRAGVNIISFPEGTRSKTGELKAFKKGLFGLAMDAGVDVIPVAVIGAREVMPAGKLKLRPGPIHVAFGAPINTARFSNDVDGLANEAREQILKMREEWRPKLTFMRP
jgi:1-acyl-sn-glycerol-3-phosphate acyltransferase